MYAMPVVTPPLDSIGDLRAASIVECLKVATKPEDCPPPELKIDGTALLIEPSLIGKRQTTVLVPVIFLVILSMFVVAPALAGLLARFIASI